MNSQLPKSLYISTRTYQEIVELLDTTTPQKIRAIKILRRETSCGLKLAKESIEGLMTKNGWGDYPRSTPGAAKIHCGPRIKKMTLDFGEGEIEVDLEAMQMRVLMEMQVVGLEATREILDLVETLEAFSRGKKIGVCDDEA